MIPLPPVPPGPTAFSPDAGARPHLSESATAVAPPDLGRAAVTSLEATAKSDLAFADPVEVNPLEPPADPPPVKGLGIPPLHMEQVGDQDKPEALDMPDQTTAASLTQSLAELAETTTPLVDLRR
ncbi:MAG: hypothetical protein AAF376_11630 [Pseudomonadota bacterium]